MFLVVDEKGKFREDNFQKALSYLGENVEFEGFSLIFVLFLRGLF